MANGTVHTRTIDNKGHKIEVEDYYAPNDPDEYVMILIDHISLIDTETIDGRKLNLAESMVHLSSNYLIKLSMK